MECVFLDLLRDRDLLDPPLEPQLDSGAEMEAILSVIACRVINRSGGVAVRRGVTVDGVRFYLFPRRGYKCGEMGRQSGSC